MNIIEKPILDGVKTLDDLPGHEVLEERLDIYVDAVNNMDVLENALGAGDLSRTDFLDHTAGAYNIVCGEHVFVMDLIGDYLGQGDIETEISNGREIPVDERLLMCFWFHDHIDTIIAKMSRVYFENNFTANVVEARIKHQVEQNNG